MTRRERMERRLARRLEWAESRDLKSEQGFKKASNIADKIPMGQPILVGHHSEGHARRDQSRIESGMRQGVESMHMAAHHRSKADGIASQLDRSIFSDDPDAIEQLQARIAELEAKAATIKAYNITARQAAKTGGHGDLSLLAEDDRTDLLVIARVASYQLRPGYGFPAYKTSNLNANIRRLKQRLAALQSSQGD